MLGDLRFVDDESDHHSGVAFCLCHTAASDRRPGHGQVESSI
jgi:hypothetical protein